MSERGMVRCQVMLRRDQKERLTKEAQAKTIKASRYVSFSDVLRGLVDKVYPPTPREEEKEED